MPWPKVIKCTSFIYPKNKKQRMNYEVATRKNLSYLEITSVGIVSGDVLWSESGSFSDWLGLLPFTVFCKFFGDGAFFDALISALEMSLEFTPSAIWLFLARKTASLFSVPWFSLLEGKGPLVDVEKLEALSVFSDGLFSRPTNIDFNKEKQTSQKRAGENKIVAFQHNQTNMGHLTMFQWWKMNLWICKSAK